MTPQQMKYFYNKIVSARKSMQLLEEELGNQLNIESPVLPKRKNRMREHFERRYEHGIGGKPIQLKSKKNI
jgi:hypothetical protein